MSLPVQNVVSARHTPYKSLLVAATLILAGIVFLLWPGRMPFEASIRFFAGIDIWDRAIGLAANPDTLRKYYSESAGVALMFAGLLMSAGTLWGRLTQHARGRVFQAMV